MIAAAIIFGALFFAAAAYLGIVIGNVFAERIEPLPGGPEPHSVPIPALLTVAALIGAIVVLRGANSAAAVQDAILCIALCVIWVTDARRGVVPDAFTLGPLLILSIVALWAHQWTFFIGVAVPTIPFAAAAMLSKGRGMGWGDVKLVALGGALLTAAPAILAFALACLAAVAVNYARGRKRGVIALGPYLTTAIAVSIPVLMWFH